MYCEKCGTKLGAGAACCNNCGAPLDNENATANAYKHDPNQRVEPDQVINVVKPRTWSTFVLTSGIITTVAAGIESLILIPIIYVLINVAFYEINLVIILNAIFTVIAQVVSGIHGIIFCRRPERMGACLCWGFVWLAFRILDILVPIMIMLVGPMSTSAVASLNNFFALYGVWFFLIFLIGQVPLILYFISVAAFKRRA